MYQTWVNGKIATSVNVADRGFSYGDGLFTTIKVTSGQCELLTQHLVRLQQGIDAFAIEQVDFQALLIQLNEIASELVYGVIKVVITRGVGTRGYSSSGCLTPTVVVTTSAFPGHYETWRTVGLSLGVSTIALGISPLTAGIKHLNRLEQVLVRQQIDEQGWDDAIVLDCQACVIETGIANVFWRTGDTIYTPNLDFSGVKGIMREQVIKALSASNLQIVQARFKLSSVIDSDEIFLTNCLMGIVPVVAVESRTYHIGALTRQLQESFNQVNKEEQ